MEKKEYNVISVKYETKCLILTMNDEIDRSWIEILLNTVNNGKETTAKFDFNEKAIIKINVSDILSKDQEQGYDDTETIKELFSSMLEYVRRTNEKYKNKNEEYKNDLVKCDLLTEELMGILQQKTSEVSK